ncbi:NAD(P)H-dependent oxidoreductase [Methanoregula sp.]|uniref:NADPH-dependent FMN reductase n=1 Tax=Methanoregula sp. TaxID=2052170 RepID=UPI002C45A8E1|nr:NAD(P)H-dependent oxidoreductase [Methanoregula sp.]HVP95895.1 NAD(P)H-dependent oxidoreductase [Methanoregula sp.]
MSQYQIAVLVGSLRKDSLNQKLATGLTRLAPPGFSFTQVQIADLPLYNQDNDDHPAAAIVRMKDGIKAADGLLFVSPEYNRSIPGVLKNALDCGSRPTGQSAWAGKPAGIIGVSTGAIGTAMAQQHLRNVLSYLDVAVMRQPEAYLQMREGMFDPDGNIGAGSRAYLQNWMDKYVAWIQKNTG